MAIPYTPTANAYKPPVSPTGGSTSPLPTNKTQTYSPLPTNTQPATAPKFGDPIPFTLGQKTVFPTAPTAPVPTNPSFMSKVGSTVKGVGDFITSSEQAFGNDIAAGASAVLPDSLTGKAQIDTANKLDSVISTFN